MVHTAPRCHSSRKTVGLVYGGQTLGPQLKHKWRGQELTRTAKWTYLHIQWLGMLLIS